MSDPSALPTFAQVAAATPHPPPDSPASFLAWALGVALAVIVILWGLREKTNRDALTRAIADKELAEQRQRGAAAEHKTEMATLRAHYEAREAVKDQRIEELQSELSDEIRKGARMILAVKAQRSATPQPMRTPYKRPLPREEPDDYEMSTAVTQLVNDVERERIETEAVESTPPGYRRPLPSKPR